MTVVGVGNPWRRDDGAGPEVARRVGGRVLDGEPAGLIEALSGESDAIVVDAVCSGAAPGTVHRLEAGGEPLPTEIFGASSTHALGLAEAVELARALGRLPGRLLVYGIEGADFSAGTGLSPDVEAAVEEVAEEVRACTRLT